VAADQAWSHFVTSLEALGRPTMKKCLDKHGTLVTMCQEAPMWILQSEVEDAVVGEQVLADWASNKVVFL
jgi:hypothetical protein